MKFGVRHILVEHRYQAEDILSALTSGKKFEDLAKVYSKCSSSKRGGDLGTIEGSRLDTDFEEALSLLKIGEVTSHPIRTRFGYHIIFRYS